MIRAGKIPEITSSSGDWLILDIGFSNQSASCGLLINQGKAEELRFNEAKEKICTFIQQGESPINLMIEAPLSVSFDMEGNPKGRSIEKQGGKTRYWYVGLGCTVMVAALYLVRSISNVSTNAEVRLFEGFVSFKNRSVSSNHSRDVELLREVVDSPERLSHFIVDPSTLKMDSTDRLESAFCVAGIDTGVPPIIMRSG
jgi:hypothetical protein